MLTMPPQTPALGVSTKGLPYHEALAKCIEGEFTRRVDPRQLTLFLPHDLLTQSDEVCSVETVDRKY